MKSSTKKLLLASFCLIVILVPILAKAQLITALSGVGKLIEIVNEMGGGGSNESSISFGTVIIGALTLIASSLAQGILSIGQSLLNWVISPDFMGPTIQNNPIVQNGWETIKSLANVVLIFGLVAVAISIIVGFQETKAKKALINFVLIALLINFTPVFCGIIIDFADKIMSLFLTGDISSDLSGTIIEGLASKSFSINNPIIPVAYLLFALLASVIYFLYAFLFMARHIVLWFLVIVSPIAFASKVFPQSQYIKVVFPSITYWDDWWKTFLQWVIIGIPAGFSIYLSEKIMFSPSLVSTPTGALGATGSLFTLIIPLAFLIIGFFVTISSGGQIGEMATGYGRQAVGKLAAAGTGFAAGAYTGAKTQAELKKDEGWAKRAAYTIGGGLYGGTKTGVTEALSAKVNEKEKLTTMGGLMNVVKAPLEQEGAKQWATRAKEVLTIEKPGTAETMKKKQFEEFKKPMENLRTEEIKDIANSTAYTPEGKIKKYQAMQVLMEKKSLEDSQIEALLKNTEEAEQYGFNTKDLAKFVPDKATKLTGGKKTTTDIMSKMSTQEKMEKIRPASLTNLIVRANLSDKDIEYMDLRGTQQQRDVLQDDSPFENFNLDHIKELNLRQLENLFKNLNEKQKQTIKKNKAWIEQVNDELDKLEDSMKKGNEQEKAEAQKIQEQLTKKIDVIFRNLI